MTKKLLKTSFAFILSIKINKSKVNFPSVIKVKAANLFLKVHCIVLWEGMVFTFVMKPAVI